MPVVFESDGGTVFAASNSNAAITVPLPPTRPVGSVLVLVAWSRLITAAAPDPSTTFTLLSGFPKSSGTAAGGRIWVYVIPVIGGEAAPTITCSNAVTGNSGDLWGACIFCYSGVDTSGGGWSTQAQADGMLDGTPTVTDASGTTACTYPALTISNADSMLVRCLARFRDAADTFTPTATWNEREDLGSTVRTGAQFHLQDKLATASGSQAAVTVAPSNVTAARYLAVTLALKGVPVATPKNSSDSGVGLEGATALRTTSIAKISLAAGIQPIVRTGHAINVRARVTFGTGTLGVALYEGVNNRSGDLEATLTTSLADYAFAIPQASAANITNYSNLDVWVWGKALATGTTFEIDQIWLEIPEAPTLVNGADTGIGTDSATVTKAIISTGDVNGATEAGSLVAAYSTGDLGTGVNNQTASAVITAPDVNGIVTEGQSTVQIISFTSADTGTGVETPAYSNRISSLAPIAYWRLGASPLVDASGNGNTLTVDGTPPAVAPSLISDSDGSRDFSQVGFYAAPNTTALQLPWPRSIEFWVSPDRWEWQSLVRKYSNDWGVTIPNGPAIRYFYHDGTNFQVFESPSGSILLRGTQHVVITDNGTTIRFYVNGVETNNVARPNTLNLAGVTDVSIGAYGAIGYSGGEYFDGRIDEVALYNKVLSAEDVKANYIVGSPQVKNSITSGDIGVGSDATYSYPAEILVDSPAAYYRMGEISGQLQDSSGNGSHTNAIAGTLSYGQGGAITDGNTAISFPGTAGNRATLWPIPAPHNVGDVFTIEAWIKRAAIDGQYHHIITVSGGGSGGMRVTPSGQLQLTRAGIADVVASTVTITDTTSWHHLVITKNGATVKLYIDSVDVTGTVSNQTCTNANDGMYIGCDHGGSWAFNGSLDEIAIYPTALSAARISTHYSAAFSPPQLKTSISTSDVGTGANDQSLILPVTPVNSADVGITTEVAAPKAVVSSTDTGTSIESATISVPISTPDLGAGVNNQTLVARYTVTDVNGAVTEATGAISQKYSSADNGIGSEVGSVGVPISGSDAGVSAEAITDRKTVIAEVAIGSDNQSVVLPGVAADNEFGNGIDVASVTRAVLTATEVGTDVEAFTLVARITAPDVNSVTTETVRTARIGADTATAVESATISAPVLAADIGVGIEAISAFRISVADAGTDSEAATRTAALSSNDSATGIEAQTQAAQLTAAEIGTAVETQSAGVPISTADSALGVDSASVVAATPKSSAQTGIGVDSATVTKVVHSTAETAISTQATSLSAALSSLQTGSGSDSASMGKASLTGAESASGIEQRILAAILFDFDVSIGIDTSLLETGYIMQGNEPVILTDAKIPAILTDAVITGKLTTAGATNAGTIVDVVITNGQVEIKQLPPPILTNAKVE